MAANDSSLGTSQDLGWMSSAKRDKIKNNVNINNMNINHAFYRSYFIVFFTNRDCMLKLSPNRRILLAQFRDVYDLRCDFAPFAFCVLFACSSRPPVAALLVVSVIASAE